MKVVALLLISFSLTACQTADRSPKMQIMKDFDEASTARGEAYTADAMHFRKPMPDHSDWQPTEFYYKHCSEIGEQYYFSKTSYDCSSAP